MELSVPLLRVCLWAFSCITGSSFSFARVLSVGYLATDIFLLERCPLLVELLVGSSGESPLGV